MEIKPLGHSSFRLKSKEMSLVTDPFDSAMVGLPFPKVNAEIVTLSHRHDDHGKASLVAGTEKREQPFVIDRPGEYEVGGVGVIGIRTWHDDKQGEERGENIVFVIQMEGVIVCHLGDLGHPLSEKQLEQIGAVDVLLVPVGGVYTIGPSEVGEVIKAISPSIVVPMHYRREGMGESFAALASVNEFLEKAGLAEAKRLDKLVVNKVGLPEDMEVVVLE